MSITVERITRDRAAHQAKDELIAAAAEAEQVAEAARESLSKAERDAEVLARAARRAKDTRNSDEILSIYAQVIKAPRSIDDLARDFLASAN